MKAHLQNFIAGFISTLIFHQGSVAVLHAIGIMPNPAYNMTPTAPFGVPSLISISFFGGLWGILLGVLVRRDHGARFWVKCILFGAFALTTVAFLVVFPLKGMELKPVMIPFGLFLNGMWGFGTGLLIKLFAKSTR